MVTNHCGKYTVPIQKRDQDQHKVVCMQDFTLFLSRHAELTIAVIIILLCLTVIEILRGRLKTNQVDALRCTQLMNHEQAQVIDIRPAARFNTGHIINAVSLQAADIKNNLKLIEKFRSKPLIIVCENGVESQKLAAFLLKNGFNVYSLSGGIRAWNTAQMPLVKE